jgi:hypothetical protein
VLLERAEQLAVEGERAVDDLVVLLHGGDVGQLPRVERSGHQLLRHPRLYLLENYGLSAPQQLVLLRNCFKAQKYLPQEVGRLSYI